MYLPRNFNEHEGLSVLPPNKVRILYINLCYNVATKGGLRYEYSDYPKTV